MQVIAGKYLIQYTFSACASATTVSVLKSIGTGPASILSRQNKKYKTTMDTNYL